MSNAPKDFDWLFSIGPDDRPQLTEHLALIAKLKIADAARYEELLAAWRKARVPRLRELDAEVSKLVRDAKATAKAKVAKENSERREAGDGFKRDDKGGVTASQANVRHAFKKLGVRLRYDSFRGMPVIEGLDGFGPALDDGAMNRLWLLIDERFGFRPPLQLFQIITADACQRDRFNPVCDYLDGLSWDGVKRLDAWLASYLGAADSHYVRAVGSITLIAAVRRVRQPGCKFDEALILESAEGFGKSTALETLAVEPDWFSDSVALNVSDQKMIEGLAGKWIVELAELQGMRKADIARLKAQLSRQRDRARLAYGRLPVEQPRQSVFIGTLNPSEAAGYLASLTGNRRFWPVEVTRIDLKALRRDRDQLWAEASVREAAGESIRLDRELWAAAEREQAARQAPNPFVDIFAKHLASREGILFAADAWELVNVPAAQRGQLYDKLGAALRDLGWIRRRCVRAPGAAQEWAYAKGAQYQSGRAYQKGVKLIAMRNRWDGERYLQAVPYSADDLDAMAAQALDVLTESVTECDAGEPFQTG